MKLWPNFPLSIHSLPRRTNGHLTKTVSQSRAEWSRVQSCEKILRILPGYSHKLGPKLCMSSVIFSWLLRWQCTFPPLSFARSGVRKFGTAFKCARCPSWIIPAQSHLKFRLLLLNLTYGPNVRKKDCGRIRQEQPSSSAAPSTPRAAMPRRDDALRCRAAAGRADAIERWRADSCCLNIKLSLLPQCKIMYLIWGLADFATTFPHSPLLLSAELLCQ